MYKDGPFSAIGFYKILIIKTSSLGDIIQSFPVLPYLHRRFSNVVIDWVVEESFASIVRAHPLIRKAIPVNMKQLKKHWFGFGPWRRLFQSIHALRQETYHIVFDLQGNCKSGAMTFCAKGNTKVGLSLSSVREWPNILATQVRFKIPQQINIRQQHLQLLQRFFKDDRDIDTPGVCLTLLPSEQGQFRSILQVRALQSSCKIMVCPGSKWVNKQLPIATLCSLLGKMHQELQATFLLVWGGEEEKRDCEEIQRQFPTKSYLAEPLSLPLWQNLMHAVDLIFAVDSSALHLCGTTATPSFSVFGPTDAIVFKPLGPRHFAYQGKCPYGRTFAKTCPVLRSCATGACIRNLAADAIYDAFIVWWRSLDK